MTKEKGFGIPRAPKVEYQRYYLELKRRFHATDNSELLLGTATVYVPKTFKDLQGEIPSRRVWDAIATCYTHYFLHSEEVQERECNQIFIFDNRELIDRVESNPWEERGDRSRDNVVSQEWAEKVSGIMQQCKIEVQWEAVPVAA